MAAASSFSPLHSSLTAFSPSHPEPSLVVSIFFLHRLPPLRQYRKPYTRCLGLNIFRSFTMEFSEDNQNSAPGSVQAAKLSGSRKGPDSQSTTKRYVAIPNTKVSENHLLTLLSRLQTELMQLMTSPAPGVSAFPSSDGNLLSWTATIEGPDDTPYTGLTFKLSFAFSSNYPYSPPTVLFKTPIYHPNVDFSGRICLDILKDKWTAAYNIQTVLLSLQSLLGEPNKYTSHGS